jgi:hypothetical protein
VALRRSKTVTSPRDEILSFFEFDHFLAPLREVGREFSILAHFLAARPENREQTVALRKLLEARDAAVRAELLRSRP